MVIDYFRPYKFICLLLVLLSNALYAADNITIKPRSSDSFEAPINSIKLCPALDNMIEDNGGYAKYRDEPLLLCDVTVATFRELSGILRDIYMSLSVPDIKKVDKPVLRAAIEKHIKLQAPTKVLEILTAASALEADEIVKISAMIWAISYSAKPSTFNALSPDAMKEIIEQLTPKEFLALVKANESQKLEEAFKVATIIHFEEEPKSGEEARKYYEELERTSEFVRIPGREYDIGSQPDDKAGRKNERLHRVTLKPYWIGKTVVTQKKYFETMGKNPSYFKKNGDYPVENLTWFEAQEYAKKRSENGPWNYTLVSEEQWEAAARAGSPAAYVSGQDDVNLGDYVHYYKNSNCQTHPVKSKSSNAFGMYLDGGVCEWTVTEYNEDYSASDSSNPTGPKSGSAFVVRGGGWCRDARDFRLAIRCYAMPESQYGDLGVRLLRTKKSSP